MYIVHKYKQYSGVSFPSDLDLWRRACYNISDGRPPSFPNLVPGRRHVRAFLFYIKILKYATKKRRPSWAARFF